MHILEVLTSGRLSDGTVSTTAALILLLCFAAIAARSKFVSLALITAALIILAVLVSKM